MLRLLSAAAIGSLAFAIPASAQLSVDRSEVFLRVGAGNERVALITVNNASTSSVQGIVRLEDWDRSPEGSNRWFPVGTVRGSCGARLNVFPLAVSLAAGASQVIRVSLADSVSSLPEECWNAVMVETMQPPSEKRGVGFVIRTAVKLYALPSKVSRDGEITDMRVVRSGATDSVEVWFKNTGTAHYIAKGKLEFRRADNSVAAEIEMPEYYILPGAHQRVRVALPKLTDGDYVGLAMVDFGGSEIAAMQLEHSVRSPASRQP